MTAVRPAGWRPLVGAFVVWFAHFMGCWVAAETWPRQWPANVAAWVLTALALAALAVERRRLHTDAARGRLAPWQGRVGCGAVAIAAAAVVFGALPSLVFLP